MTIKEVLEKHLGPAYVFTLTIDGEPAEIPEPFVMAFLDWVGKMETNEPAP